VEVCLSPNTTNLIDAFRAAFYPHILEPTLTTKDVFVSYIENCIAIAAVPCRCRWRKVWMCNGDVRAQDTSSTPTTFPAVKDIIFSIFAVQAQFCYCPHDALCNKIFYVNLELGFLRYLRLPDPSKLTQG
jgi:hypothetical protein